MMWHVSAMIIIILYFYVQYADLVNIIIIK